MNRININFIAQEAGVSPATVSRVLNKTKPVSPELTQRVEDVIAEYQYQPSQLARGLTLSQTNTIGMIVPAVSTSFHAELTEAIEREAKAHDFNVIISNIHGHFEEEKRAIQLLQSWQIDGLLLCHENTLEEIEELKKILTVPLVLASSRFDTTDFSSVSVDDETASYDAVSFMADQGHEKVVGVFSDSFATLHLRQAGFRRAARKRSLDYLVIEEIPCTIEGGVEAAQIILGLDENPTAIFFVSDEMAIGAINYFHDHGYRIPRDYSIVSFDGIAWARIIRPKLTTVRQPIAQIGRCAVRRLIEEIRNPELVKEQIFLSHEILVQDSCIPPTEMRALRK